MRWIWVALAMVFYATQALAEIVPQAVLPSDTFQVQKDSTPWSRPKKATILALTLPGSGQIYNKRYWKAGLVYAGGVGIYMAYRFNQDSLNAYQTEYINRLNGDTASYGNLSTQSIRNFRNQHRRYRDISLLGFAALYALQVIDANVDAHLQEFRVNKDLSLKVKPSIYAWHPNLGRYSGVSLTLNIH
jgi:hypothetical protein